MIKYNLICKQCELSFDSWFMSSNEYEKLKKKLLSCYNCNSFKVEKNLMAPKFMSHNLREKQNKIQKINDIKNTIREYQKFIKANFKYVGENFAYEARSIHYNKKRKKYLWNSIRKRYERVKRRGNRNTINSLGRG